ncbi:MAG: SH3 domain-containing protein, partial [Anaerolineae bacterium]|nr:SH3 domain-containing protein [Anaerolineae bacterium]
MALTRRLRALSAVCLVIAFVAANFSNTAQAQAPVVGTVIVDELYMRSAPSRNGAILDTLRFGQRVEISGRSRVRGWGYGRSEAGAVGWIVLQYLEFPANANLSELPIVPPDAPTNPAGGAA